MVRDRPSGGSRESRDIGSRAHPIRVCDADGVVQVRFLAQPFADGRDLRDFLSAVGTDVDLMQLDVVVAWAKRSGLSRLQPHLETIRDRGGHARLVVGIDEGGATRQGLELARALFDNVHVFHDRSGRTFHPKIYLATGEVAARLLVGSHNATAGGVFFNYEAGVESVLTLPDDDDLLESVQDYIARLYADTDLCKDLTDAVLAEMVANPRYRIGDEDARRRATPRANEPEELDSDVDLADGAPPVGPVPSIFGTSTESKRTDPGTVGGTKKATAKKASDATGAHAKKAAPAKKASAGASSTSQPSAAAGELEKRWFKKMSHSDAQQPKTLKSNVKGVLTLNKNRVHPIDTSTYFRTDFFDGLAWTTSGTGADQKDEANIVAEVVVDDTSIGSHTFTLDHAVSRISGQNNSPTWLHWGNFGQFLRGHDRVGGYVTIERLQDGSFRVVIADQPAGPFVK